MGTTSTETQPSEPEWMNMMAGLLAQRFQLRFHWEKRDLPVYVIVPGPDGPKLKRNDGNPEGPGSLAFRGRGQLAAINATLAELGWELQSAVVDRPIVDQTGLTSRFNFTLTWTPDEFQKSNLTGQTPTTEEPPNLFTAVQQQLGLRLEAAKSLVEVMVIDHVERPSEN